MPRRSLPADLATPRLSTSTPSRPRQSLRKRKSPTPDDPPPPALVPDNGQEDEEDPEAEFEAWQDFAAEHYEMVEQLPLELHRNFRLLRELDDGCAAQTEKLHALIREYINLRIPQQPNTITDDHPSYVPPKPSTSLDTTQPAQPELSTAEQMGVPLPDGAGGLVLPENARQEGSEIEARLAFPERLSEVEREVSQAGPSITRQSNGGERRRAARLLPDIGRLSREIVRNAEEKVAVATGAYNSIDRHIRALDSALSAEETSLLLGLRPSTLPSNQVEGDINDQIAPDDVHEEEELDAAGRALKGRRGKKGRKSLKGNLPEKEEVKEDNGYLVLPPGFESDPNEPIYCYCRQVALGQMIGCENEDCPYEWFHYQCAGLTSEPAGKWFCKMCRPKVGFAQGGAGGEKTAHPHKRRKRIT